MGTAAAPGVFVLPGPDIGRGDARQTEAAQALRAMDDGAVANLYRRAYWLRRQGDARQAGHLLTALLLMRPDQPAFWTAMGECCAAVQDHDNAALAMARAAQLQPDHAPASVGLVRSLLVLGRSDLARPLLSALMDRATARADTQLVDRLTRLNHLLEHDHAG